jgi:hypothetical protein
VSELWDAYFSGLLRQQRIFNDRLLPEKSSGIFLSFFCCHETTFSDYYPKIAGNRYHSAPSSTHSDQINVNYFLKVTCLALDKELSSHPIFTITVINLLLFGLIVLDEPEAGSIFEPHPDPHWIRM